MKENAYDMREDFQIVLSQLTYEYDVSLESNTSYLFISKLL